MKAPFLMGLVANRPSPVLDRPIRNGRRDMGARDMGAGFSCGFAPIQIRHVGKFPDARCVPPGSHSRRLNHSGALTMKWPARQFSVQPIDAARNEDRPMKTVLLLLLAMLAIKTTSTTSAVGQDACSKPYVG